MNNITYDMLTNGETHRDRLRALADVATDEWLNEPELPIRFGYYYCVCMPEIYDLDHIHFHGSGASVVYTRDEKGDTER